MTARQFPRPPVRRRPPPDGVRRRRYASVPFARPLEDRPPPPPSRRVGPVPRRPRPNPASGRAKRFERHRSVFPPPTLTPILSPPLGYTRIAFVAAATLLAAESCARLVARYGAAQLDQAQVIVALGGDGFHAGDAARQYGGGPVPVFGMNCGSVGFLMNAHSEEDLPQRLALAQGGGAAPAAHACGHGRRRGGRGRWR